MFLFIIIFFKEAEVNDIQRLKQMVDSLTVSHTQQINDLEEQYEQQVTELESKIYQKHLFLRKDQTFI